MAGDTSIDRPFEASLTNARDLGPDTRLRQLIDGKWHSSGTLRDRADPSDPTKLASRAYAATQSEVLAAVESARRVQKEWGRLSFAERNQYLLPIADAIDERRFELAGVISAETGKTRIEALAEVQECIDLVKTYCEEIRVRDGYRTELRRLTEDERNVSVLRPYGVFAVIAPFNFPAALPWNMVLGALVTGNTAVLKPAPEAPSSGALVGELALNAGLPTGVLNVVHGGARVGAMLVSAPVDGLAFTGSAKAGHAIAHRLHATPPLRPLILEMGGKNPAIVTGAADLDCAAEGIARAAFGLSGQKCSSCSRVIVTRDVHDDLVDRLVDWACRLRVADPLDPASDLGPVITDEVVERYGRACGAAQRAGATVVAQSLTGRRGFFISPTLVLRAPRGHQLTRRELFMPLLTVTPVDDLADALDEANAVEYGLTAGIFSESPEEQRIFLDEAQAGVLYVNRRAGATTGAWPGVQSFCGWKQSGASGKGGLGPNYLPQFMREQSHTVMRPNRGS
jgi:1-pyrroline-5-carboxylate dehydrogenase